MSEGVGEIKATFGGDYGTAQIYSKGFELAFMSPTQDGGYQQACTFVYCKDFLHDAVWAQINKEPWQIFGFKYNPKENPPLDMGNCSLAFRNLGYRGKDAEFHAKLPICQSFLNQLEEQMGFEPTNIFSVPNGDVPTWMIVGDKGWQIAPPILGLYTLLIRLGFQQAEGVVAKDAINKAFEEGNAAGTDVSYAGSRDASYLRSARKGVELMLKHGAKLFYPTIEENYPAKIKDLNLHNAFGPVSFTQHAGQKSNAVKNAMPFWYRPEIWES